jgi:uncharacterized protein YdhG (YjbR/CyaY superfamily)
MTELLDHDAYIAAAPEALRSKLTVVRACLTQALPDAEEAMRYGMPGFASGSVVIIGYGAFSKQCGLYVSKGAINAHADDIAASGLKASKTGVTFSPTKPMPDEFITAPSLGIAQ